VDYEMLDYLRTNAELTLVAYAAVLKEIYDNPEKRARHTAMG
jgi:hypothetical protein